MDRVRVGKSPGKTLLWVWLRRDLKSITSGVGIDAACGFMGNRKFFCVDDYVGFDLDESCVKEGLRRHADVTGFTCSIVDAPTTLGELKGDVVVCVQTLNTNSHFDSEELIPSIERLIDITKPGGTLLLNIGSKGDPIEATTPEVARTLARRFPAVEIKRYGFLHKSNGLVSRMLPDRLRVLINLTWAYVMDLVPPLRTAFGFRWRKVYVRADGRYGA